MIGAITSWWLLHSWLKEPYTSTWMHIFYWHWTTSYNLQHEFSVPGGWCYDNGDRDGRRSLVATVDTYDVTTDVWSVETQVPKPKFHAGIAIVSDKLYIVGGCLSDILFDRTSGKFLHHQRFHLFVPDLRMECSLECRSVKFVSCSTTTSNQLKVRISQILVEVELEN